MDFGVLHQVSENFTLGAALQNFVGPQREDIAPVRLSLGGAYRPLKNEKHPRFCGLGRHRRKTRLNLGAEYVWGKSFAVRGGVYRGKPVLGVGLFNALNVTYAPDSTLLSVSLGF